MNLTLFLLNWTFITILVCLPTNFFVSKKSNVHFKEAKFGYLTKVGYEKYEISSQSSC